MQGYASRESVLRILLDQERTGAFLKDLFPIHAGSLSAQDRALTRQIALGVVRNRSLLDYNIDKHTPKKVGKLELRTILRLTAYQLFFLDVPAFAAIHVGVELAKRRVGPRQGGFANAVLKRMAAGGIERSPGDTLAALAVNFSHPLWLLKRWHRRLGRAGLMRALERNNQEAPAWIRVNPFRAEVEALRCELSDLGAEGHPDDHAPLFLRLDGGIDKALHSEAFARGAFAFQDPAAWLIAELADWRPGDSLLDLCSAPGGKAACLVERARYLGEAEPAGPLVCNDISHRRLRRIRDARERLGHRSLWPVVMDPARPAFRSGRPRPPGGFDVLVVDAPCSNLGVVGRRPEARWAHSPPDLVRLAGLQKSLLASAARLAGPVGRIIYATCSPEEEETSGVIRAFLEEHPGWGVEDASSRLPAWAVKEGFLWLHPGESEYDGFFGARLIRTGMTRKGLAA